MAAPYIHIIPQPTINHLKHFFRSYTPQIKKNHRNGDDYDPLIDVEEFVAQCIDTDLPGFHSLPDKPPRHKYFASPLADWAYKLIAEWLRKYHPTLHYSAPIDLFFKACIELGIAYEPLEAPYTTHRDGRHHALRFNQLVERIRTEGRSSLYRNRLHEMRSRAQNHFVNWMTDIDYLFEHVRSRIIVIRIDLSYRRDVEGLIDIEQADSDFKRFLANTKGKPTLFEDMLYYVWKVEQSRSGAYHFHLLLLFTCDRLRNDAYRAQLIGEYWANEITQGRGAYFNLNASTEKAKQKKLAIGRISSTEHEKRDNLKYIIAYFCKDDQSLRVKVSRQARSYGASSLPTMQKIKRGRPRHNPQLNSSR